MLTIWGPWAENFAGSLGLISARKQSAEKHLIIGSHAYKICFSQNAWKSFPWLCSSQTATHRAFIWVTKMQKYEQHETIKFPCFSQECYCFFLKSPDNKRIQATYTCVKDIDGAHIYESVYTRIIYCSIYMFLLWLYFLLLPQKG